MSLGLMVKVKFPTMPSSRVVASMVYVPAAKVRAMYELVLPLDTSSFPATSVPSGSAPMQQEQESILSRYQTDPQLQFPKQSKGVVAGVAAIPMWGGAFSSPGLSNGGCFYQHSQVLEAYDFCGCGWLCGCLQPADGKGEAAGSARVIGGGLDGVGAGC